jgi:serine phosphatase RsbU (regulator of sigma subunit)
LSFRAVDGQDVAAALVAGGISCGLALLLAAVEDRQRAAVAASTRLAAQNSAQHAALDAMQRAILPDTPPPVLGVQLGWCYAAGAGSAAPVGGDWYAFVPLSATCLGVAVGDVAGHGLPAITSMAEYRYALRTLAADGTQPAALLDRLEQISRLHQRRHFSTCIYGLINTVDRTWTYTSAGHPPPLLIRDRHATQLRAPHGVPVGTGLPATPYGCDTIRLRDNDLLALYTDGLVERRGEHLNHGIARLADRLSTEGSHHDLADLSGGVVHDLVGPRPADDVALVLIRYRGATYDQTAPCAGQRPASASTR